MQYFVKQVGGTLARLDTGEVLSLNPPAPYHWETRPVGTAGAYEVMAISGSIVTYNPTGHEAVKFLLTPTPNLGAGALVLESDPLK